MTFPRPFPRSGPFPRGSRGTTTRGRWILPVLVVLAIVVGILVVLGRIYTELLWFRSVDFASVYTTQLRTQVMLFFIFGIAMAVLVGANIVVAHRLRPTFRPPSPEQENLDRYRSLIEPYRRWLLLAVVTVIGIFAGASAGSRWRTWLLWRNAEPFGHEDPQFGKDVSYFAFTYPFQRFLLGFAFTIVVLSVIAAAVTYYLYGALRIQTPGEKVTPAARAHLSLLIGLFVLLKAVAYFLDRYGLAFSLRGVVTGPSYTDVNAVLPAKTILVVVAVICAGLFFANVAYRRWTLPLVGFGTMVIAAIVVGGVYPAIVQQFQVKPSEQDKEAPYIQRNIAETRLAYGLTDDIVEKTPYAATTNVEAGQLRRDAAKLPGIRLLDPNVISPTYNQLQQIRGFYTFPDVLDIDRYEVNGEKTDAVVAVRDINLGGLSGDQNNWINRHLVYTHGFGFVAADANTSDNEGRPQFFERNIPPVGELGTYEPRVYFGENSPDYSIVGGPGNQELDRPTDEPGEGTDGQVNTSYRGEGGIGVDSFFRKMLYAVKYREKNILLSDKVGEGSRILYVRDPRQRVEKVAPYLRLDGDPYPAVINGRILWIVDGYTTSNGFPYSQRTSLGEATQDTLTETRSSVQAQEENRVNYIRNSVKATVDAYHGTVTLYQWDEQDPVLKTWMNAFPDTVQPKGEIPDELEAHFRYPEDLFKVQRELLTKYHVTDARSFYSGQDFWAVPSDPTLENRQVPQPPYYFTVQMPGQTEPAFSLTSTLVPRNRSNMAAYVAVNSDPGEDYGKIRILQLPRDTQILGVGQVFNNFETFPRAASQLSLLRRGGSDVTLGNLLTLPIGGGLLFVEPVYVKATGGTSYPLLKFSLASFGDSIAFEETLQEALDSTFGGESGIDVGGPEPPDEPGQPTGPTASAAVREAVADARAAYARAQRALRNGNFAAYGEAQEDLGAALQRLERASAAQSQGASNEPSPSPAPEPSASETPTPGPSP